MDDDAQLRALGERLITGWPLGSHEVTDELRALATTEPPFRDRVLADLALLVRCPRPIGFGREVALDAPVEIETSADGRRYAHRVRLRIDYARHMSGADPESTPFTIERVIHEPAGWRIHALYSDADRADVERWLPLLDAARRGS